MNKYLNEERYQSMKKKIILIATIVLVVGLVLSATLLGLGFNKKSNPKDTSQYEAQIATLKQEIVLLDEQIHNEFMNNGFSSLYYSLDSQRDAKFDEQRDIERKVWNIEHDSSYVGFFAGGIVVLVLTLGVSGGLYFYAYRRSIMAFGVQQTMPIAQEGMEAIAPSLGKVTEEITKGISRGKNKDKE